MRERVPDPVVGVLGLRESRAVGRRSGSGEAVTHFGNDSVVSVWGGCDSERAGLLRERLEDLAGAGQRRITLEVSELRFADFTPVAILVGAMARIRQLGADVAVCPPGSSAYRVLKRADLTTARAVGGT